MDVNLEYKMPTTRAARIRLDEALRMAKRQNTKIFRLIHGYGSSGKGGAIKKDISNYLIELKKEGKIFLFVAGEEFSPFNAVARELFAIFPEIYKDKDYAKSNFGITIVVVQP